MTVGDVVDLAQFRKEDEPVSGNPDIDAVSGNPDIETDGIESDTAPESLEGQSFGSIEELKAAVEAQGEAIAAEGEPEEAPEFVLPPFSWGIIADPRGLPIVTCIYETPYGMFAFPFTLEKAAEFFKMGRQTVQKAADNDRRRKLGLAVAEKQLLGPDGQPVRKHP